MSQVGGSKLEGGAGVKQTNISPAYVAWVNGMSCTKQREKERLKPTYASG